MPATRSEAVAATTAAATLWAAEVDHSPAEGEATTAVVMAMAAEVTAMVEDTAADMDIEVGMDTVAVTDMAAVIGVAVAGAAGALASDSTILGITAPATIRAITATDMIPIIMATTTEVTLIRRIPTLTHQSAWVLSSVAAGVTSAIAANPHVGSGRAEHRASPRCSYRSQALPIAPGQWRAAEQRGLPTSDR